MEENREKKGCIQWGIKNRELKDTAVKSGRGENRKAEEGEKLFNTFAKGDL